MICLAMLIGIANPMPILPPVREKIAVLIPITSPELFRRAPRSFPGLMEASVWMKFSYGPAPICLYLALTMPAVTVLSRPKGFPSGNDPVAYFKFVGIAHGERAELLICFYTDKGQIGFGITAYDFCTEAPAAC